MAPRRDPWPHVADLLRAQPRAPLPLHMRHPLFSPGDVLSSRYRLERFLAIGGGSEVYEAFDLERGERVALKALRRATGLLGNEAEIGRRLSHPNLCRVLDAGCHQSEGEEDVAFLVMEYLEGSTLAERLREWGPFAPEEALALVRQMATGLGALHGIGVAHGDFKTSNVILVAAAGGPRAVVTDFGSASREATPVDEPRVILATPAYLAPELRSSGQATTSADLYALGVVMYEMLTGELPFSTETQRAPRLAPPWEAAIRKCLQREPADRFQSTAEVIAALG